MKLFRLKGLNSPNCAGAVYLLTCGCIPQCVLHTLVVARIPAEHIFSTTSADMSETVHM